MSKRPDGLDYFVNSLGLGMIRIPAGRFKMRTPPPLLEVAQQSRGFERPLAARYLDIMGQTLRGRRPDVAAVPAVAAHRGAIVRR